MHILTGLLY